MNRNTRPKMSAEKKPHWRDVPARRVLFGGGVGALVAMFWFLLGGTWFEITMVWVLVTALVAALLVPYRR